jgi:hypothetical protein
VHLVGFSTLVNNSSLRSFLSKPATSSVSDMNFLLTTLLSKTPDVCAAFNLEMQVTYP